MGEERITEMAQLSDLEYLRLSKGGKFLYKLSRFFTGIPRAVGNVFLKLWDLLKKGGQGIGRECADIAGTFAHGDWKT